MEDVVEEGGPILWFSSSTISRRLEADRNYTTHGGGEEGVGGGRAEAKYANKVTKMRRAAGKYANKVTKVRRAEAKYANKMTKMSNGWK